MGDRELLELAAKAAGMRQFGFAENHDFYPMVLVEDPRGNRFIHWNPLTDDADALRLAVGLGISIDPRGASVCAIAGDSKHVIIEQGCGGSLIVATRRAIVRTAAEIGKNM